MRKKKSILHKPEMKFSMKVKQKNNVHIISSRKQRADKTNYLPKFPEAKMNKRITRDWYGDTLQDLGLSGSSLKGKSPLTHPRPRKIAKSSAQMRHLFSPSLNLPLHSRRSWSWL